MGMGRLCLQCRCLICAALSIRGAAHATASAQGRDDAGTAVSTSLASAPPSVALSALGVRCCRLVAAFRKWLDMRGGGGPPTKLPQKLPPLVDGQEVFLNRYEQHTRHCPYCSGASILTHGHPVLCGPVHVARFS